MKRSINRNDWISAIKIDLLKEKMFSATCPYLRPNLNITLFQFKWDCLIMFLSSLFFGFSFVFPVLGLPGDLLAMIAMSRLCQCCQWNGWSEIYGPKVGNTWSLISLFWKSLISSLSHKFYSHLSLSTSETLCQSKNNGVLTQPFTVLKSYLIYFRTRHILLPLVFTLEPRSPHH